MALFEKLAEARAFTDPEGRPVSPLTTIAGAFLAMFAAACYYISYLRYGFNAADTGNYVQIVYELWSGTDPHDVRLAYGVAWYKLGEALFSLIAPSYLLAKLLFYALLTVTVGLVYAAVERLTRNRPLAIAGAAAVALAPAFPPTAFYAFCTLLNLLPQTLLARRWRTMTPLAVIPAGLALGVAFQIRADFGYVFAAPLGLLLLAGGVAQGPRRLAALLAAALLGVGLAHGPLIADGLARGYLDIVLEDYGKFPRMLLNLLAVGLDRPDVAAAGTLLARPPLAALWQGPPALAALAFVVYAPAIGLAGYGAYLLLAAARAARRGGIAMAADRAAPGAALLAAALASFPHYFLYRPDLPHVANFMAGYTVLACVFAWELAGGDLPAGRWRRLRPAGLAAGLAVLAAAAVYVAVGLTTEGTGSAAHARDRNHVLKLASGERVLVSQSEQVFYSKIKTLVEENSRPGERIVCLPYCPGVAFMTGRRMLLRDYYVDDFFLVLNPGWIEETIELTRREKPPVALISDWAINGTEFSRFPVWGKAYIAFLETAGYRRIDLGGMFMYLRPDL